MNSLESGLRRNDKLPDEPRGPSCLGRGCLFSIPTLATVIALEETAFAIIEFVFGNNIRGGFHTFAAIGSTVIAGSFGKYYFKAEWNKQRHTLQEQFEGQSQTEKRLEEHVAAFTEQVGSLSLALDKITEQEGCLEARNREFQGEEKELIKQLRKIIKELGEFPPLIELAADAAKKIRGSENVYKDFSKKLEEIQGNLASLRSLPEEIQGHIQESEIENEPLNKSLSQLVTIATSLELAIAALGEEFDSDKNNLTQQLAKLKSEREVFRNQMEIHQNHLKEISASLPSLKKRARHRVKSASKRSGVIQ